MSFKKTALANNNLKTSYASVVHLFKSVKNSKLYKAKDPVISDETVVAKELLLHDCKELNASTDLLKILVKLFVTYNGLIKTLSFNFTQNSMLIEFIYEVETTFKEMFEVLKYSVMGDLQDIETLNSLLFQSYIYIDLKTLTKFGFVSDVFKVDVYKYRNELKRFVAAHASYDQMVNFL